MGSGLSGVILVDKPEGPTSSDVVLAVRRLTGARRCGHTGTLDPFASGLLPICVGSTTRLARFMGRGTKSYRAVIRFGWATDTYDRDGRAVGEEKEVSMRRDEIEPLLAEFLGRRLQVPPPYSAKKVGGERLYRLAREGRPAQATAVEVFFESIELESVEGSRAVLTLSVGAGTYIRAFAHDLGTRLGVGAHVEALRRTRVGSFSIDEARGLDTLEGLARTGRLADALVTPADALAELPALRIGPEDVVRVRHGQRVGRGAPSPSGVDLTAGAHCRLLDAAGGLVAVGLATESDVRPVVVLA